jgi:hypothetical protein
LNIIHEALIRLSSIIKEGEIESASRPPYGVWCLNDKTIKELISFANCETGKMPCECIEAIHKDKKNFIKWERRESIDDDSNVCSLKAQRVVWIMIVIEEGSTRAWPQWTIHQRRASERLGIEVLDLMEKRQEDIWVQDIDHAM